MTVSKPDEVLKKAFDSLERLTEEGVDPHNQLQAASLLLAHAGLRQSILERSRDEREQWLDDLAQFFDWLRDTGIVPQGSYNVTTLIAHFEARDDDVEEGSDD